MIGPYDFQPSHFGTTMIAMAQGRLQVIVDAGLNWVDTRDVADGMIHASEQAKPGEKYILSGHWASLQDIAQQVAQFSGHNSPRIVLPLWMAKLALAIGSTLLATEFWLRLIQRFHKQKISTVPTKGE